MGPRNKMYIKKIEMFYSMKPRVYNQPLSKAVMFNRKLNVYISSVHFSVSQKKIMEVFHTLEIGKVSCVLLLPKPDATFNSAFIYFETWFEDSIISKNFQAKVLDPNTKAKIVYNDPWYWVVEPIVLSLKKEKGKSYYKKRTCRVQEERDPGEILEEEDYPEGFHLTEEDYLRMEEYNEEQDDKEALEDFDKILADGFLKEDIDRCEEYFNFLSHHPGDTKDFIEPYPYYQ